MKIAAINGSPKGEISNSREVISILQSLLPETTDWIVVSQIREQSASNSIFDILASADVLVIVFPLYVDGLPASLMQFLEEYAHCLSGRSRSSQRVFAVANCGFYEGIQNELALRMIAHFCEASALDWCGGAGIGTGEMILGLHAVPAEAGIRRPIFDTLRKIAGKIIEPSGRLGINLYTQHKIPWLLYKIAGEAGWRQTAKKNGLKIRDLNARPLTEKKERFR